MKKMAKYAAIAVFIWLCGSGVFYLGFRFGEAQTPPVILGIKNAESETADVDFGIFWEVWKTVKSDFVKKSEVKDQDLVYGAVSGMVNSLDDPYSVFFPPEDAKKFSDDINGSFTGIGAEIGIRNKQLIIVAPLKNSPAERAGIKAGDKILKIDETATFDMAVDRAVKLIRGPKDTVVVLTILRDEWDAPKPISIKRDAIIIPTVDLEMKDGGIAYVQLYNFNENAGTAFYGVMSEAFSGGLRGMVLDLRNNPGGYLEVAVSLAGWFLDRGEVVVQEKFSSGDVRLFRANGNEALKKLPLVVLTNEGSASASEILAGALRDVRGVKLVGEKSFGKGVVQELRNLPGGASLKISVAEWLMPKGGRIDKVGLEPDYKTEITEKDAESGRDPQLEKAMEILQEEMAKSNILYVL